jgi:hypothetical protein
MKSNPNFDLTRRRIYPSDFQTGDWVSPQRQFGRSGMQKISCDSQDSNVPQHAGQSPHRPSHRGCCMTPTTMLTTALLTESYSFEPFTACRLLYVPQGLTFTHSATCFLMCFVWLSEQTAIISLYNINWLVFITEVEGVYCAVRTGSLYKTQIRFILKGLNTNWRLFLGMKRWPQQEGWQRCIELHLRSFTK